LLRTQDLLQLVIFFGFNAFTPLLMAGTSSPGIQYRAAFETRLEIHLRSELKRIPEKYVAS
jgi:hypothetical protein